ncbi:MAG TPA: 50S ribosomal protein L4 [Gemmatimonadales bacterium]|nr:50S ribosomal protein L4 [Gemmatimonadales bacterium]
MIEAPHYSAAGARRDSPFALPADVFDGTVNEPVLHTAVRAYLNNQRQGTHQTKTRSVVSGGNQKPWKQKGTGRARQGSTRAPHWRGGGTVFGPQPRDYTTDVPRKVRQLARRSALNARARETGLHVVERFSFAAPKTGDLAALLGKLGIDGRKVLVLTAVHNPNVYLSGRNIPNVEVMRYADASAYHILWSDALVVEEGALTGVIPEPVDEPEAAAPPNAPKRAKAATTKTARKAKAAARKPGKKAATKKSAKPPAKKPAARKKKGD